MRIPSNWPTLQRLFLWGVTFWRCRDLQAWCVSRTRFLARNSNSLCVCCSLSESRSFLLYFTILGDISCCLCSEMGRTKAELRAKKKMLLKRATCATKGNQQPAHDDPPATPPPLPSSRCPPRPLTLSRVERAPAHSDRCLQVGASGCPRRFARRLICGRIVVGFVCQVLTHCMQPRI